ncbi:hypothetical protein N1851_000360 [Merluccius polli]|uniref:Tyr recombinase domain-containing protein n=1 Tax=Merluccius polli TaxID=89951 RepID=A0AA47NC58_MERPO|nr:hypothetical protein N1851_000360 [Merluccius polli]
MSSAKRVGELHALSVSQECLQWSPDGTGVTLWPNPSFLPKTFSATYANQTLSLGAFEPPRQGEELGQGDIRLCPVRSDSLFVCHTGQAQGQALSKQRLSKWIVEAISYVYSNSGLPIPPCVRGHSTRSVAASWAVQRGVPLFDICRAASWASTCTFARLYRVNVATNLVATATLSGH